LSLAAVVVVVLAPEALAAVAVLVACYRQVLTVLRLERLTTSSLAVAVQGQALKALKALVALIPLLSALLLSVVAVAAQTQAWGLDPAYLGAPAGGAGLEYLGAPQAEQGRLAKAMMAATAWLCVLVVVVVQALLAKTAQVVLARAAMVVTGFLLPSQVPQPTMQVAVAAATRLL